MTDKELRLELDWNLRALESAIRAHVAACAVLDQARTRMLVAFDKCHTQDAPEGKA